MKRPFACIFLFWLAAALACSSTAEPTIPPPPITTRVVSSATGTAGPAPVATVTTVSDGTGAAATPTLAGGVDPVETPISLEELGEVPEEREGLAAWLLAARAGEIDLAQVCEALIAAQWHIEGESCEAVDLDDDEEEEWLLTLDTTHLDEEPFSPQGHPGDFWVVQQEQVYQQLADVPELAGVAPTVVEVADMTGDDNPEVVTVAVTCGAHTCYHNYDILSTHHGELASILDVSSPETEPATDEETLLLPLIAIPTVDSEEVIDANEDGLDDLVLHGGIIGSAGAGIHRAYTEVWVWDGEAITLESRTFDETDYRHHRLYDANLAFDEGDYGLAAVLYEQIVVDERLEDVQPILAGTAEDTRRAARQFAAFRLAMLPLFRGDVTEATRWRNWLNDTYPAVPIAEAATLLVTTWEGNGNNLPAACAVVTDSLQSQAEPPTGPLMDLGYANPMLTAEDVCPLQ